MTDEKKLEIELTGLSLAIGEIKNKGVALVDTHGIYVFDFYCGAILNRSINIIKGFIMAINNKNFIAAAPLVRIHLDSLLRLYAAFIVDYNIDDFAKEIISGRSIRQIKDKDGNRMTDKYLVDKLSTAKGFEWISKAYEAGNGFVHLSEKHVFSSCKVKKGTRVITGIIKEGDDYISINEKIGATITMAMITNRILWLIDGWIERNKGYEATVE